MRVITGFARGKRLKELKGKETRPTLDRVKEGIFNAIQFDIENRRVLDLFAGTGQLGIECLSRGAASAVFVDHNMQAIKIIRDNLISTGLEKSASIIHQDSIKYLQTLHSRFDLIFLDPPYHENLLEQALIHIGEFDILNPYGIIIAEHPAEYVISNSKPPYWSSRSYKYGKIVVTLYRSDISTNNPPLK